MLCFSKNNHLLIIFSEIHVEIAPKMKLPLANYSIECAAQHNFFSSITNKSSYFICAVRVCLLTGPKKIGYILKLLFFQKKKSFIDSWKTKINSVIFILSIIKYKNIYSGMLLIYLDINLRFVIHPRKSLKSLVINQIYKL